MNRKKLSELAWDVSESEYRSDSALSYSVLSNFFKNGPRALINKEKVDSSALRAGSTVDCLLTAPEEFDDRFYVADIDKFSDTIRKIIESVYDNLPNGHNEIELEDGNLIDYINQAEYQTNWKDETRIKKVIEQGKDYFTVLKYSTGKIVISPQEFSEARQCVMTLKTHPWTYQIFECNEDEEMFYQLKFKTEILGINCRCMFDIIKVNHKNKTIEPLDLKTTGAGEEDFEQSFIKWNYWCQSGLYSDMLRKIMMSDKTFVGYDLLPFKFVVINKNNLTPLIWSVGDYGVLQSEIKEKLGVTYLSLLQDANWHLQNDKFDYSRKSYKNNGCNPIILKL